MQNVGCTGFVDSPLLLPNGGLAEKQNQKKKSKNKTKKLETCIIDFDFSVPGRIRGDADILSKHAISFHSG